MSIDIRKAAEQDYEGVAEIYEQSTKLHAELELGWIREDRPFGIKKEDFLEIIDNKNKLHTILVALVDDEIVGFAELSIKNEPENEYFEEKRFVWIDDIAVKEGYKRQGIGSKLLAASESWALNNGANAMELSARYANKDAIKFYDELGYETYIIRLKKKLNK